MRKFPQIFVYSIVLLSMVALWGCKHDPGQPYPNQPPIAHLSNVPPPDRVVKSDKPRMSLMWWGDDGDGYVIGYKYRWSYTIGSRVIDSMPVGGTVYRHQWSTLLNISASNLYNKNHEALALMIDSSDQNSNDVFLVYHYFATLPSGELGQPFVTRFLHGDTVLIEGVKVFASNPDSVQYPVHRNPTSGEFIFDSQDSLNIHTFELAAIDDRRTTGPPAQISFITPRVSSPTTEITGGPSTTDTVFIRSDSTDTFKGVVFSFVAADPNSRTKEYQWNIDSIRNPDRSLKWTNWSSSPIANVLSTDLADPYQIRHVFSVRSKNEFGSIDTLGSFLRPDTNSVTGFDTVKAHRVFYTQFPLFLRPNTPRQILVINKSYRWDIGKHPQDNDIYPGTTRMENYYKGLFSMMGRTNYTLITPRKAKFLGRGYLAAFSTIVLVCDAVDENGYIDSSVAVLGVPTQKVLTDYCYIGGNLVTSSINLPSIYNTQGGGSGDFFNYIFHTRQLNKENLELALFCPSKSNNSSVEDSAFSRAIGIAGYPDVQVEPSKLDPKWTTTSTDTLAGSPKNHGLFDIWNVLPVGFGEYIYQYHSDHGVLCFENSNIGVRYQGISFNSIFLGFPLYYMKPDQAAAALNMALHDCGE